MTEVREREMLAVVTHGPRDYRVETMPVPQPGPGELLVEVEAIGICASDMKCWLGGPLFWGLDNAGGFLEGPVIAGHEYAGRVVALGDGAGKKHGVGIGDRVVAEQIVPCEACRYCERGQYWMCQRHWIFGFKRQTHGGMAKYNLFPANARVHRVPDSLSAGEAAYIEPMACAWHAVDRGDIRQGDTVVVCGVGNIGLCMLQIAKLRLGGTGKLIALDAKPYRLELARRFGADEAIDVTAEDAVARVRELTDGYGCDVYIEASGNPAAVQQGLEMVRKLGTFVEFSVFNEPATVNWTIIGDTKELNIHGSHLGPGGYEPSIRALADGSVDVRPLLAQAYPLDRFDEAMAAALSGDVLKTLVVPV
ncbi:MAG TPA: zinc-binding dehydrogenase [Thermomicrobiales bacterium]|jgi:threonine dehydrogenase-like Zn-dependent dehydrogenase|nr:zinc-binding dehydrogenase [Thermomicrobiales bacterium]